MPAGSSAQPECQDLSRDSVPPPSIACVCVGVCAHVCVGMYVCVVCAGVCRRADVYVSAGVHAVRVGLYLSV